MSFFFRNFARSKVNLVDFWPSGCSAVRLAHLLWEQGVPGSNPGIPTNKKALQVLRGFFFIYRGFERFFVAKNQDENNRPSQSNDG